MKTPTAVNLALEPVGILAAQGLAPDPWQVEVLQSGRQVLLNCSRQAARAARCRSWPCTPPCSGREPGAAPVAVAAAVGGDLPQGARRLPGPRPAGAMPATTQTRLELANGSRIVCLPGREETIRSFGGVTLLVIDEAARVPDDLYRAVRPMLAVSQGRLICLSTPFGQRGFFYDEWDDSDADWQRVRIPWQRCPRITPDFIAEETPGAGRRPGSARSTSAASRRWKGWSTPTSPACCAVDAGPDGRGRRVGGIDFGFRNPFAAVWGALDRDDVLWITGERYAARASRSRPRPAPARGA